MQSRQRRHCPSCVNFAMETAVTSNSKVAEPRSRRRRKRDSIELTLFSYVRSQCNIEQHSKSDYCTHRNCHFLNLECLERLLKSARKSIRVAMYQFSVRSLNDAILTAKENNNVDVVQVIVDNKMRLNQGATFQEMIRNGECGQILLSSFTRRLIVCQTSQHVVVRFHCLSSPSGSGAKYSAACAKRGVGEGIGVIS